MAALSTVSVKPVPDLEALPDGAFLTRQQVAVVTGFSIPTFKVWARSGRGPRVTNIEGRPRYRVADVRDWLEVRHG